MDRRRRWRSRPSSKRKGDRDLEGQRFGRLIVIEYVGSKAGHRQWRCRCDCGIKTEVRTNSLTSGNTSSCGCQAGRPGGRGHGLAVGGWPPEYWIWRAMIQRCTDESCSSWGDYGGRGIGVCEEWRSFPAFYEDMGPRPKPELTLDRIDNDGDYEPDNCWWATRRQQSANRRKPLRTLTHEGRTMLLVDWARKIGISRQLLKARIDQMDWSVSKALNTPVRQRGRRG